MRNNVPLGTLTIASSGTTSPAIPYERIRYLDSILIWGPSALTGTVTVEVSYDGTNFGTLQSAGSDVEVGPDKVVVVLSGGFQALRLVSGSSEASARVFNLRGTEEIGSI
jgi:hypothetical protein